MNPSSSSSFSSRSTNARTRQIVRAAPPTCVTVGPGAPVPPTAPGPSCLPRQRASGSPMQSAIRVVELEGRHGPTRPGLQNGINQGSKRPPALHKAGRNGDDAAMSTFAVVAHRVTPTNTRLGSVLTPAQALARLAPGDVALGRLDVLADARRDRARALGARASGRDRRDRAERAAHARRSPRQAPRRRRRSSAAGIPHPRTTHVAPWLPLPEARAAARLQAALRLLGPGRHPVRRRARDRTDARRSRDAAVVRGDRRARAGARRPARLRPAAGRRGRSGGRGRETGRRGRRVADERRTRSAARAGAAPRRMPARSRSPPRGRSTAPSSASTCCRPTTEPGSCSR